MDSGMELSFKVKAGGDESSGDRVHVQHGNDINNTVPYTCIS